MTETKETSLAEAVREAAGGAILVMLPADQIRPNPKNFYEMSDLEPLAASIDQNGQLDPLKVRADEDGLGYVILDGERRYRAMTEILGRDAVQCRIMTPENEIAEEMILIESNRMQRKMSASELSKQAERYTELLSELKARGMKISGRLRDQVAEAMHVSSTKLARLHAIRANLVPELLALFDANRIGGGKAYELSQTPAEFQTWLAGKPSPYIVSIETDRQQSTYLSETYKIPAEPEAVSKPDTPAAVSTSDTVDSWNAEAYLAERSREDANFHELMGRTAGKLIRKLRISDRFIRQEGIAQLKEFFGRDHSGWCNDDVDVDCSPKGVTISSGDGSIQPIQRTWTDAYDTLCAIALDRFPLESVSESDTKPAGLVWHDTLQEGPPPAGTLNVICWGDAGLYKPMAHLLAQEFDTFPENCRWWATVEGPEA